MSTSRADCPFLAECADAYREASADAARLRTQLSEHQLTWKPDDRTWSVVECVEHLNVTVGKQIEKMRLGALEGRSKGLTGGAPPFGRGTWFGRFVVGAMTKQKKMRTLKSFNPIHSALDTADVFERFRKTNQELVRLSLEADGLDLGRIMVGSAPSNLMKMSLGQAFRLHVLHHARHLAQAEALRELEDFPR